MDIRLDDKFFIVTGASSGFGEAIARKLIAEGASVLAVARSSEKLEKLKVDCGSKLETMIQDVTADNFPERLVDRINGRIPSGMVVNAGGPPSGGFFDTSPESWIMAYNDLVSWKVKILSTLVPLFIQAGYGRIVMIESVSVKQPVDGLILSNTFRPAIVGMARTLATEIAGFGITINILAPGYHETAAMQRLFIRKSNELGISLDDARRQFIADTGMGKMGNPVDFAELAVWLLSPSSGFITGQVISVAGNLVKGILG
ncbi:MAG: short-chain dehydrogenase/reductase SDR [Bacteroidetes bacterium]|nr:MAG: short-chain dehydrogenase/reductase SDR [Bacteroidota bacterium]